MKNSILLPALISFAVVVTIAITNTASATLTNKQDNIEQHLGKRDKVDFLPNLLPVIINNSDILQLTDEQLSKLITWRDTNSKKRDCNNK